MENSINNSLAATGQENGLYEYLLVGNSDAVTAKMIKEKQEFYDRYKEKMVVKTQPHITIASIIYDERLAVNETATSVRCLQNNRGF